MSVRAGRLSLAALLAAATVACGGSSPTQPSIGAVTPLQPTNGAQVQHADQPLTLVVQNASGATAGTTYSFEIATDSAFSQKVYTKDGVAQGSGQTSVTIDTLTGGKEYYWHARTQAGSTAGTFGSTFQFAIGAAVVLNAPTPVAPANGFTAYGWPTFKVANSTRTGPVGAVAYRFEVATSAAFTTIILTGTVPEAADQTSFAPATAQAAPSQNNLFWHAVPVDQTNGIAGPASTAVSFTYATPTQASIIAAQEGLTLWSGTQPPGTSGHAKLGPGWDVKIEVSYAGDVFASPTLQELQLFDLIDRDMEPGAAIAWLQSHGYFTDAEYYPSIQVIGIPYQYMALIDGEWELVRRVGG